MLVYVDWLKPRITWPAVALGLLALLAACTTVPSVPDHPVTTPFSSPLPIAIPEPVAASPEAASAPMDPDPPVPELPSVRPRPALLAGEPAREFERGAASWYGPGFHGRLTASGERYNMNAFTAAHRTLPFGTLVRVHSLVNGRAVDLRITDRGPFSRNRIIDVSRAAAAELGMLGLGFKEVVVLVPESIPAVAKPPAATARPRIVMRLPSPR